MVENPPLQAQFAAPLILSLPDETSTEALAQICASHLGAGDSILLSGPVGAGKSHFARALIRAYIGQNLEVPSPSFTLVQCYAADTFEIWHADLYRLGDAGEVAELGLDDAMGRELCLIEWPDRLATAPQDAVTIALSYQGEGRRVHISGARPALRAALSAAFAL